MRIDEEQSKLFKTDEEKVADQFQLVEQKVRSLIELAEALKQEKADLIEKLRVQEEALDTLSKELVSLRAETEQTECFLTHLTLTEWLIGHSGRSRLYLLDQYEKAPQNGVFSGHLPFNLPRPLPSWRVYSHPCL